MRNSVLIIAAHPDDEVLGCGGTICHHIEKGDEVNVLIMVEGATSRADKRNKDQHFQEISNLSKAARKVQNILGIQSLELNDLPDNRLDSIDLLDLTKIIESKIEKFKPNIVYTHHSGDVNIDHRRLHKATVTACRPTPESKVKRILSFETVSSTEWQPEGSDYSFQPNWFVNIEKYWPKKKKALKAYQSEMREWPHPRSIEGLEILGKWRGSQIGMHFVEAFKLLRNIE